MASSVSSVALIPIAPITARPTALRPVEAGYPAAFDADASRRDPPLRAETSRPEDAQPAPGRTVPAPNAAFLTQLLAQDLPPERRRGPFAEAALAYGRFRQEPVTGIVLDPPQRVDLKI